MDSNNPAILQDVAHLANVSTATVSRVINDSGYVSAETRDRVLQAIDALGYKSQRPRIKAEETSWVAIITQSIEDSFNSEVISGAYQQVMDEGRFPLILEMPSSIDQQINIFKQLQCLNLVGLISDGFFQTADGWLNYYDQIKVPIVVMNTKVRHPEITSIIINFEKASYRATQHLLNLNHTRIAYLGVPDFEVFSLEEYKGIIHSLSERGLDYPDEYKISVARTPEGASQGISRLMALPPEKRPSAIYAFDDQLAIYAINSIHNYGLRIPGDISIIGFDNILMAAHTNPPLTTVHVPKHRIGSQAVHLMNQLIKRETDSLGFVYIDPALVVRDSTGPAPKDL